MRYVLLTLLVLVFCYVGLSAPEVTPIAHGLPVYICKYEEVIMPPDDWDDDCYRVVPDIQPNSRHGDCRPETYQSCLVDMELDFYRVEYGVCEGCSLSVLNWETQKSSSFDCCAINNAYGGACSESMPSGDGEWWRVDNNDGPYCPYFGGDDDYQWWYTGMVCNTCLDDGT